LRQQRPGVGGGFTNVLEVWWDMTTGVSPRAFSRQEIDLAEVAMGFDHLRTDTMPGTGPITTGPIQDVFPEVSQIADPRHLRDLLADTSDKELVDALHYARGLTNVFDNAQRINALRGQPDAFGFSILRPFNSYPLLVQQIFVLAFVALARQYDIRWLDPHIAQLGDLVIGRMHLEQLFEREPDKKKEWIAEMNRIAPIRPIPAARVQTGRTEK